MRRVVFISKPSTIQTDKKLSYLTIKHGDRSGISTQARPKGVKSMANLQIPIPDTLQDELKAMFRTAAAQAIEEAVQHETVGKEWLNQKTVCEWLGISFVTLQSWKKRGLQCSVIQGKTLISKKEINRFLEEHQI